MHKHFSIFAILLVSAVVVITCIEFVPMPKRFFERSVPMVQAPTMPPVQAVPAVSGVSTGSSIATLNGMNYRLVSYNSIASPGATQYTVSFVDGKVSAKFCNGMGGEYTFKNGTLLAPSLMGTQMFCESPKGLMDAEQLFGNMLGLGAVVTTGDDTLTLTAGNDTMVFVKIK